MKEELFSSLKKSFNKKIIGAFKTVPRENFVLKEYKTQAYEDIALPILAGQTISQPTTVAIMTEALEVKEGQKILEIGTGSGYQAAILSRLVKDQGKIFTTEIIEELVAFAKKNLKTYKNVKVIHSDGSIGLKQKAPFDRIIVTAACPKIPNELTNQLKKDGILVAPVGGRFSQKLIKYQKKDNKTEILGDFIFVPLTGKKGFIPPRNEPK